MLQSLNTHLVNANCFCVSADKQCAFHELAAVKAREKAFATKVKMLGVEPFPPYHTFFRHHFIAFNASTRCRQSISTTFDRA